MTAAQRQVSAGEPHAGEAVVADLVRAVIAAPERRGELAAYLREDHPIYRDRPMASTRRIRGWLLAAFERVGCDQDALAFALEELSLGRDAYTVAAAARAVRGAPAATPGVGSALAAALENIVARDEWVDFTALGASGRPLGGTTALGEVLRALTTLELGGDVAAALHAFAERRTPELPEHLTAELALARAAIPPKKACCARRVGGQAPAPAIVPPAARRDAAAIRGLALEDQGATRLRFGDLGAEGPAVVVFFYTRCDNPQKCSLTIARLAELRRKLDARGQTHVGTFAITYDPAYDTPARLAEYGAARTLSFGARSRVLRTLGPLEPLASHLELGVGFVSSLPVQHRIELFVLDREARVAALFARALWDEAEVLRVIDVVMAEAS